MARRQNNNGAGFTYPGESSGYHNNRRAGYHNNPNTGYQDRFTGYYEGSSANNNISERAARSGHSNGGMQETGDNQGKANIIIATAISGTLIGGMLAFHETNSNQVGHPVTPVTHTIEAPREATELPPSWHESIMIQLGSTVLK